MGYCAFLDICNKNLRLNCREEASYRLGRPTKTLIYGSFCHKSIVILTSEIVLDYSPGEYHVSKHNSICLRMGHSAADARQDSKLKVWKARPKTRCGAGGDDFAHLRKTNKDSIDRAYSSGKVRILIAGSPPVEVTRQVIEAVEQKADCIVFTEQCAYYSNSKFVATCGARCHCRRGYVGKMQKALWLLGNFLSVEMPEQGRKYKLTLDKIRQKLGSATTQGWGGLL